MYRILFVLVFFISVAFSDGNSGPESQDYQWKTNSVLNSGIWMKIKTTKKGIYKITYDKLKSWGFTSPELVNVYGSGGYKLSESLGDTPVDDLVKNRSWRGKDASGKDCLFFFSTGTVSWKWDAAAGIFQHTVNPYSSECYYFLSQEGNAAWNVETSAAPTQNATVTVNSFDDYLVYESELYNLIESGQQWFGEKFIRNTSRTFSLNCVNPVQGSTAYFMISGAGRSALSSSFDVTINQTKLSGITFNTVNVDNATTQYADEEKQIYPVTMASSDEEITMVYSAANSLSEAWLDYITINWRRQLKMSGDELYFRDSKSIGGGNIAQFTLENETGIKVLDITDPSSITEVAATEQGNQLVFKRSSNELHEYLAYKPTGDFPEPTTVGQVTRQNLHGLSIPDFLIITHPDFLTEANKVADFHRTKDGMNVQVVTVTQVYNEFGSGIPDATAIRNFIKMFYDRGKALKYVLLYGDGSFDNRNITGANKAFIPTFQSDNSLTPTSSFVSDDYFVVLDQGESVYNGSIDIGIGRLPVSSAYESQIVANKIMNYYSSESMGLWRTNLCFIADDDDGNLHVSDSEALADLVNSEHREFQTDKIYFDAYTQETTPAGERYPGVVDAINKEVKDGVLILNYVGHANARYLADERVLDVSGINAWTNINNLPIFVTATCEFSRFDASETSAGEYILLNPNGGGIGLFSTTRMVYAYSNYLLSRSFYNYAFGKDSEGLNFRMGDIMRLAKNNTLNTLNKLSFTLLADPALRLSYPKYKVVTKTINHNDASLITDTLKALSKVTVTGEITNNFGVKLTAFTGELTAVVYDKATTRKTLGNAGETPFTYKVQDNIIYKGEATVSGGDFTFSFVIPKDITYNLGNGKILYYAQNGTDDANGAYENFIIGGSSDSQISDTKGPDVNLYLDKSTFKDGDETSQNPLLLADVSDENGINTVGAGIGHDITAVLDNNNADVMVLNEYYKASKDDYTHGTISYPLRGLSIGEHSLKLKVWDVANNSTEVEIKFKVTGDFYIDSVSNYPNPVYQYTDFIFVHNQPDATFKTLVEIFDITGNIVDSFQTSVSSNGTSSTPLRWDMNERGITLCSGIYLYRITIRSGAGQLATRTGKMLISR